MNSNWQALETRLTTENTDLRNKITKLEAMVVNLSSRVAQNGFAQPQPASADAASAAAAAAAKEAIAQAWMRDVYQNLPLDSLEQMEDFNKKLEDEEDVPYMKAAAEQLGPNAKQATNLAKFYQCIFGDWVTDNVSYARGSVSVI